MKKFLAVLLMLAMLLCGASSIRDVILFPTMKSLPNDK